ncbi:MAG: SpoIIE family protein phosphatase [Bacteroidales bacterium]|nr:SpoIIE family protein phosphatase [Bacteroidales bacterium]
MTDPSFTKSIVRRILLLFLVIAITIADNVLLAQSKSIPQSIKDEIAQNDQLIKQYTREGKLAEAATYLNRSAYLFQTHGLNKEAAAYYTEVLEINRQLNNQKGIQLVSNTLGMIYIDLEQYNQAIEHLQKALQLSKQFHQSVESVSCLTNIALAQQGMGKHKEAITTLEEAISIAKELTDLKLLRRCYGLAYDSYDKIGNTEKSYAYFELYSSLDKEIKKQEMENVKSTAESEVNKAYAARQLTEEELKVKKEELKITADSLQAAEQLTREQRLELELRQSQIDRKEAEIRIEKMKRFQITALLLGSMLFTVVLIYLLYLNIRSKRKIHEQKELLEIQNRNITASIRYAKTIQQAILPDLSAIKKYFDVFVLYQPKDIVSGDFYWFSELHARTSGGKSLLLAVVDCTGHGVPGAFMSMIGNRLLNEIVNERRIDSPKEILEVLNTGIRSTLRQEQTDNNDGMDISICRFEKIANGEVLLTFAGAKRNMQIIKKERKEVIKLKGDRLSIGGSNESKGQIQFKNHEIKLSKGDMLYLSTDGIIDQNGPDRSRFGTNRFEEILFKYSKFPMEEQEYSIRKEIERFRQHEEQRDDITLLGLKIIQT